MSLTLSFYLVYLVRVGLLANFAGFPPGVVNMVQGTRTVCEALIDHPAVKAVTFVGSSPIARIVKERCNALNKRCTALGGAKNVSRAVLMVLYLCLDFLRLMVSSAPYCVARL